MAGFPTVLDWRSIDHASAPLQWFAMDSQRPASRMTRRDDVAALLGSDWNDARLTLADDSPDDRPGLRRLTFTNHEGEACPAHFLPSRNGAAVLYCHAHGNRYDIGIDELIHGRPALGGPWLPEFTAMGFGVLALEMPCFGTRAHLPEAATAKARLWHGRTLFGQMLGEQRAALQWLAQAPGVDARRIATMGISMGGTLAWWLGALCPELAAIVSTACFSDLETLIATGAHDGHGPYMTVPGLLRLTSTGGLCGLAAPTPILHCVGFRDLFTPQAAFETAQRDLDAAYAESPVRPRYVIDPDAGHEETPRMRQTIRQFLRDHLD